jgi:hypothetical protein
VKQRFYLHDFGKALHWSTRQDRASRSRVPTTVWGRRKKVHGGMIQELDYYDQLHTRSADWLHLRQGTSIEASSLGAPILQVFKQRLSLETTSRYEAVSRSIPLRLTKETERLEKKIVIRAVQASNNTNSGQEGRGRMRQ